MKHKHLFILLFATLVLFLAGCSNNPEKTVNNFEKIIEEKDAKALFDAVEKEEGLVWTEKNAEQTIEYLNKNKGEKKTLINALKDQALSIKEKLTLYDDFGMFYFDEEGNIHVRSYDLSIYNYYDDLKGLEIEVDGEKYEIKDLTDEEFIFGKFGPGKYNLIATAKYDYAEIKDEQSVSLFDLGYFNQSIDLALDGEKVYLYTNYPDTKLKINGELSDITFSNSLTLGPISKDTKLQAVVSFPWGESESKEYVAGEDSDFDFKVPVLGEGDTKKEITNLLNTFSKEYISAHVNLDLKKLKNISDDYKARVHNDIEFAKSYDYTYKGEVFGTRIDFSKVDFYVEGGERYYLEVPMELHHSLSRFSEYNKETKPSEVYDAQTITLRYLEKDKTWQIEKVSSNYNFGNNSNPDEIVKTEFKKEDKKEDKDEKEDKSDNDNDNDKDEKEDKNDKDKDKEKK